MRTKIYEESDYDVMLKTLEELTQGYDSEGNKVAAYFDIHELMDNFGITMEEAIDIAENNGYNVFRLPGGDNLVNQVVIAHGDLSYGDIVKEEESEVDIAEIGDETDDSFNAEEEDMHKQRHEDLKEDVNDNLIGKKVNYRNEECTIKDIVEEDDDAVIILSNGKQILASICVARGTISSDDADVNAFLDKFKVEDTPEEEPQEKKPERPVDSKDAVIQQALNDAREDWEEYKESSPMFKMVKKARKTGKYDNIPTAYPELYADTYYKEFDRLIHSVESKLAKNYAGIIERTYPGEVDELIFWLRQAVTNIRVTSGDATMAITQERVDFFNNRDGTNATISRQNNKIFSSWIADLTQKEDILKDMPIEVLDWKVDKNNGRAFEEDELGLVYNENNNELGSNAVVLDLLYEYDFRLGKQKTNEELEEGYYNTNAVDFEYDDLDAETDEGTIHTSHFNYRADRDEVLRLLGILTDLEEEDIEERFDYFVDKYYDELKDAFLENAKEAFIDDYNDNPEVYAYEPSYEDEYFGEDLGDEVVEETDEYKIVKSIQHNFRTVKGVARKGKDKVIYQVYFRTQDYNPAVGRWMNRGWTNSTSEHDSIESAREYVKKYGKELKNENYEESLKESKQDIEKFRQWAGDELADRFFAIKDRINGSERDIYYWITLEKNEYSNMKEYSRWKDRLDELSQYVHKNILDSLDSFISDIEATPTKKEINTQGRAGAKKIYEDSRWLVVKINTYEASVKYGKHTQWCITGINSQDGDLLGGPGGRDDFEIHSEDAKIYFYIDKRENEKYALEMKSKTSWVLYDSEDYILVGRGSLFNDTLDNIGGDYWHAEDTGGQHPDFPTVQGLPDINAQYEVQARRDGYAGDIVKENVKEEVTYNKNDNLEDVENGTFVAYGKAGIEEIRDAKKRNYYIEYTKEDSAGDSRYVITIDKSRNYDGSPKVVQEELKEIQVRDNENIEKDAEECPLPLDIIPNNMGINLSNVEKVKWEEQEDGQLKKIEIEFNPAPEDELDEDIEKHDTLNQKLFDGEELKPEIKDKIQQIAYQFVKELNDDGIRFTLKDIVLLGSNVSYNYTKDSDLDIHLIADSSGLECPDDLYPLLYSAYRSMFNKNYDIKIKGIPAEIYVEMDEPVAKSNGIYSLNNGWIKKPEQRDIPDLDEEAFDKLFNEWEDKYFELMEKDATSEDIENFIEDLYDLRKESIATEGEYGLGNLVFKEFRNIGYLDGLKELRKEKKGKELSLEHLDEDANESRFYDTLDTGATFDLNTLDKYEAKNVYIVPVDSKNWDEEKPTLEEFNKEFYRLVNDYRGKNDRKYVVGTYHNEDTGRYSVDISIILPDDDDIAFDIIDDTQEELGHFNSEGKYEDVKNPKYKAK